jgi:hypothetical protein
MNLLLALLADPGFGVSLANAQVHVDSYTRKDGAYVPFHYRNKPDRLRAFHYLSQEVSQNVEFVFFRIVCITLSFV